MKYYNLFFSIIFCGVLISCSSKNTTNKKHVDSSLDKEAIKQVLFEQQKCWNNGDLDCFMKGYWNSDSLKFVGSDGIVFGYESTLSRYKSKYTSKDLMGILNFEILYLKVYNNNAHMIGKWNLERKPPLDNAGGLFTLIWEKMDNKWVIVSDHTS